MNKPVSKEMIGMFGEAATEDDLRSTDLRSTVLNRLVSIGMTHGTLEEGQTIAYGDQIFVHGYLNSLGFIALLLSIEDLRGSPIPEDELDMAKFASIDAIVSNYLIGGCFEE